MMMMKSYRERRDKQRIRIQDQYEVLGFISSGTYGKVYKAIHHAGNVVAIKKFKPDREGEVAYTGISQSACREIMLNREIHHTNLTQLETVVLQDKSIYLIFEYCEHDFLQIIHHHSQARTSIPEATLKSLLWQLLNGLNYLHSNWIIHRDLKPANILVNDRGIVKIGDLGLARSYHSPIQSLYASDKVVVTIWYRSPELLLGSKHYTTAIDIWSIGCIMAELLYLRPIFKGDEAKPDVTSHHHHHHHHHHHQHHQSSHNKNLKSNSNSLPFQKDQLSKIFDILGTPSKEDWPSIVNLPEYHQLSRFEKMPNTLRQWYMSKTASYRAKGGVGGGETGRVLLGQLLAYEPGTRVSAGGALTHAYFTTTPPLPSLHAFRSSSSHTSSYESEHDSSESTQSADSSSDSVNPVTYPSRRVSNNNDDPDFLFSNNNTHAILPIRPPSKHFPQNSSSSLPRASQPAAATASGQTAPSAPVVPLAHNVGRPTAAAKRPRYD